jgi:signal transduction histidine kinase
MKTRTALGATAVVAVALLAAAFLLLHTLRENLQGQVELQAENAARSVAVQLATGSDLDDLELDVGGPVQVVDEDGRLRAASGGLEAVAGTGSEEVTPDPSGGDGGGRNNSGDDDDDDDGDDDDGDDDDRDRDDEGPGEVSEHVELLTGSARINGVSGDYRFAVIEAETPGGLGATVYAGAPLRIEQAAADSVRDSLLIGFPPLLLVVAAVTWLVTRRALRPVEGIRRELAAITRSGDLSRRVPEPAARDEIGRLARTTNETLTALDGSVERQRRFVADASHELRSPIASLRTQLEVGQAHPELLDVPGAVKDTVRLQTLAADLLLLARLDAGERPVDGGRAEPAALVAEQLAQRPRLRPEVRLRAERLEDVSVPGSATQLDRVLGNLLDNAERHAAARVRVGVRREGGDGGLSGRPWVVVEVADDGAGVPEPDRERVFERFVRLDEARSRDGGGAGLGLAIARDVAERHGGTLTLSTAPEGGALFTLRLPAVAG